MKRLTLIRHAKSSWDESGLADFERPLNERGKRDAPEMGRRLAAIDASPDLMLASTAKRARSTAKRIASEIGYPKVEIVFEQLFYGATAGEMFDAIRRLKSELSEVIIVSHNPGITDLNNTLCDTHIDNIPTCGVVRLELPVSGWDATEPGCARMVDFDYPKRKHPAAPSSD
ncbi:MAG: histidine phosphatase family protein [Deltaproteobacteria bacterium]|nr:histidine phosphatase family protein [Deltaproteobacteria bacterium]MBW2419525.1 histidine phosphatase family protein [Deltaproteobacteria bacterium]